MMYNVATSSTDFSAATIVRTKIIGDTDEWRPDFPLRTGNSEPQWTRTDKICTFVV